MVQNFSQGYKPSYKYYKSNYIEVIKKFIPQLYIEDELLSYGEEKNPVQDFINKTAALAYDFDRNLLQVSATDSSSLTRQFIYANKLTEITPDSFQSYVLTPLKDILAASGKPDSLSEFSTSAEFISTLSSIVMPHIELNDPSLQYVSGAGAYTLSSITTQAVAHAALLKTLGLMYTLNTPNLGTHEYDLSAGFINLATQLYRGQTVKVPNAVKEIYTYLWYNSSATPRYLTYIPAKLMKSGSEYDEALLSSVHSSGVSYVSGVQLLDNLHTLVDVIYDSPKDLSILEAVDTLKNSGTFIESYEPAGPFYKYLKGLGMVTSDIKTLVDDLEDLLDIENCPPEFLEYLGRYIGWNFKTNDISLWRSQLRQAIFVYKSKGTKVAFVQAMHTLFDRSVFDASAQMFEAWESYLPFLIYYMLKTESPAVRNPEQYKEFVEWVSKWFEGYGVSIPGQGYDKDTYCRLATDYVIGRLHEKTQFMQYGGKPWKFQAVDDMGRRTIVPPFERDNFYRYFPLTHSIFGSLRQILTEEYCIGGMNIELSTVNTFITYLVDNTFEENNDFHGTNLLWKFFRKSYQAPFNAAKLIAAGEAEMFDYWCSKSSTLFLTPSANDYFYRREDDIPWGASAVDAMTDLVVEMKPFHVVPKLWFVKANTDNYYLAKGCPTIIAQPQIRIDNNRAIHADHNISGFKGTSGLGNMDDYMFGSNYAIEQNRQFNFMPSPSSNFWRASGGGDTHVESNDLSRTSLRRRNLTHALPLEQIMTRSGHSMPTPLQYYSASDARNATASSLWTTTEIIPQGWNFSAGQFEPVNKIMRSHNGAFYETERNTVWDVSSGPSTDNVYLTNYLVSSTFPVRNSITACGGNPGELQLHGTGETTRAGTHMRDELGAVTHEVWKIWDDNLNVSSKNYIGSANSYFDTSSASKGDLSSLDWFFTVSGFGEANLVEVQETRCAKLKSRHWFTDASATNYPDIAGLSIALSGLSTYKEYIVRFDLMSESIPGNEETGDGYYNNGVMVMLKMSRAGSPDYYRFNNSTFNGYDPSSSKFLPNWAQTKQNSFGTYEVPFSVKEWADDITLEFWNAGSIETSAISFGATNEKNRIDRSVVSTNYISNVFIEEKIKPKFNMQDVDFGELLVRTYDLYNYCGKFTQFKMKQFDGGNSWQSHVLGPKITGGFTHPEFSSSSLCRITGVNKRTPGAKPLLAGKNLIPNGDFRIGDFVGVTPLTESFSVKDWVLPASAAGDVYTFSVRADGALGGLGAPSGSQEGFNGDRVLGLLSQGQTNFEDEIWVSANLPIDSNDSMFEVEWGLPGAVSGGGAVRITNETRNFDYNFSSGQWDAMTDAKTKNWHSLSPLSVSPSGVSPKFRDKWQKLSVILPQSKQFKGGDTYKVYINGDLPYRLPWYSCASFWNYVSIRKIIGWRTPEYFKNTFFDFYGPLNFKGKTLDKIELGKGGEWKLNRSLYTGKRSPSDYVITVNSSGNIDKCGVIDSFNERSFSFNGQGGLKTVDLIQKVGQQEEYLKNGNFAVLKTADHVGSGSPYIDEPLFWDIVDPLVSATPFAPRVLSGLMVNPSGFMGIDCSTAFNSSSWSHEPSTLYYDNKNRNVLALPMNYHASASISGINLRPGRNYKLSFKYNQMGLSATTIAWSGGVLLRRDDTRGFGQNAYYYWGVGGKNFHNSTPVGKAISTAGEHGFWEEHSYDITVPGEVDTYSDDYTFSHREDSPYTLIFRGSNNAAHNSWEESASGLNMFADVSLVEENTVKLEPDKHYRLHATLRTNKDSSKMAFAIRTTERDGLCWYFDFRRQKWVSKSLEDVTYPFHDVNLLYNPEYAEVSCGFHTLNARRVISDDFQDWSGRNGQLHKTDREYEIVVTKLSPKGKKSPRVPAWDMYVSSNCEPEYSSDSLVSIEGLSIIQEDLAVLAVSANNVSSVESADILYREYFDSDYTAFISRDSARSSAYNGGSGGNRSLYLDPHGMRYNEASGDDITLSGNAYNLSGDATSVSSNTYYFEE